LFIFTKNEKQEGKMNTCIPRKKVRVVNFVLDETGSMASCREATISGFNEYLMSLRNDMEWKTLMTLTKFNSDRTETICHLEDVDSVKPLTLLSYVPNASTPLYDAIARTISRTEADIAFAGEKPSVFCVIQTDGEENSSKEYDLNMVRKLIGRKEKDGWKIVCLGADIDAWQIGESIGLKKGDTFSYDKDATCEMFKKVSECTKTYFHKGADNKNVFFNKTVILGDDNDAKVPGAVKKAKKKAKI
jgi:hypothetical protein